MGEQAQHLKEILVGVRALSRANISEMLEIQLDELIDRAISDLCISVRDETREACAQVCDNNAGDCNADAEVCAAEIRALWN